MSDEFDQPKSGNTMGLVGFILAILGVFTGGCFSLVALPFSIVGLGREPKGLAIAGLVISLIGLAGWIIGSVVFGIGLVIAILAIIAGAIAVAVIFSQLDPNLADAYDALAVHYQDNGAFPASLAELPAGTTTTDRYSQPLVYSGSLNSYTLQSIGEDGVADNDDDTIVTVTVETGSYTVSLDGPGGLEISEITIGGQIEPIGDGAGQP